jgi:hypothetical protein
LIGVSRVHQSHGGVAASAAGGAIASAGQFTQTVFRPALRAGLELALVARAAPDAVILVRGHPEAVVHPALVEVEDEAPAQ